MAKFIECLMVCVIFIGVMMMGAEPDDGVPFQHFLIWEICWVTIVAFCGAVLYYINSLRKRANQGE